MMQPKKRSALRIRCGKIVYTLMRYFTWYLTGKRYAKFRNPDFLPVICAEHKSPLYRQLKNVDMWLQENKVKNLGIAVRALNGIIVNPGETLSYWKLIGKTTDRKGYKKGLALFYGNLKEEIGGGLCQLSNLIYWLTLHTPLTVTERYRHSFDVFPDSKRTQPFGSGATCVYPYRDLELKNNSDRPYQLELLLDDTFLYGRWRSDINQIYRYEVYEENHYISQELWGGYIRHNELYRKVFNTSNELIDDQYITENNAIMMYQPFIENKKA